MELEPRGGLVATGTRILDVLLRKASVKQTVRLLFQQIDPSAARGLVRLVLWRDPEFMVSFLSALPAVMNMAIYATDELLSQVEQKVTPALMRTYLKTMVQDLDQDALARIVRAGKGLYNELAPVFKAFVDEVEALSTTPKE